MSTGVCFFLLLSFLCGGNLFAVPLAPLSHQFVIEPGLGEVWVFYQGELPTISEEPRLHIRVPAFEYFLDLKVGDNLHAISSVHQGIDLELDPDELKSKNLQFLSLQYKVPAPWGVVTLQLMHQPVVRGPVRLVVPRYRSFLKNAFEKLGWPSTFNLWPARLVKTYPSVPVQIEQTNSLKYEERQKKFPASMKPWTYEFDVIALSLPVNHVPILEIRGIVPARFWMLPVLLGAFLLILGVTCFFVLRYLAILGRFRKESISLVQNTVSYK